MTGLPPVARPWCKWAGGKTALLPKILPLLPQKIDRYYEPFVGGGAVFFALAAEKRFKRAVINDVNEELIRTYSAVNCRTSEVIRRLKEHVHTEEHFYAVREQDPRKLLAAERAARFIFLNRTCFNGLYRVNRKGKFNVPFGRYENPKICDEENLRAVAKALKKVALAMHDFESVVDSARKADAVYFDPPYVPASETASFTAYTKGGFGPDEQKRLADVARRLDARGVHVLLSNSDTPFVRKLYKGFKLVEVRAPRRINSNGGKRGDVGELLISGRWG